MNTQKHLDPFYRGTLEALNKMCSANRYSRELINGYVAEAKALRDLIKRMAAATTLPRMRALATEAEGIEENMTPCESIDAYRQHRAEIEARDAEKRRKFEEEEARLERVRRAEEELRRIEARERRIAELKAIIATGGRGMKPVEAIPVTVERDPNELPPPVILTPEEAKKKAMADTAMLIAAMESGNREALSI